MRTTEEVVVIGAGLAGSEAAWQAASMGIHVTLYEMRPNTTTPAHSGPFFAELVCSNSLGTDAERSAPGLLKSEMRSLGSLILRCADAARVPAGQALAVDRDVFAASVTRALESAPNVKVVREEVTRIPDSPVAIIATGPLTSPALSGDIAKVLGEEHLFFYDAAAPIVEEESIDWSKVFWASRYNKGDADYANCPLDEHEYDAFWHALVDAELAPMHEFETLQLFEGCMPVEEIARRGRDTLRFGAMKPVGLADPATGRRPYAVVQLRRENASGSLFNLVGFQTRLTRPEQRRVFRMIPGLGGARFARYGMMHRNTFINGPAHLTGELQLKTRPGLFMAGQITGVEGYLESAATGLVSGINAARYALGLSPAIFPRRTALGALCSHVSTPPKGGYQPMNINFGLLPDPPAGTRKQDRKTAQLESAAEGLAQLREQLGI